MAKKIVRAHQKLADGSYDTLHYETEKAAIVDFEHTHDDRYYTEAEMNTKLHSIKTSAQRRALYAKATTAACPMRGGQATSQ